MSDNLSNMLDLLSQLVQIDTVNDPINNKKPSPEAVKFIKDVLNDWEVEAEILNVEGYRSIYGHIGTGKPYLMFLAHLDVVPVKLDEWSYDPFKATVVGGRIYGRGTVDDKGNVVGIMFAIKRLKERLKKHTKKSVIFAFTSDEETGGAYGAKKLAEKLASEDSLPKYLINGDGIGMSPIVRRRKVFKALLEIKEKKVKLEGKANKVEFELKTPVVSTRHAAWFMPGVDMHPLLAISYFMRSNPDLLAVKVEGSFLKSNVLPSKVSIEYVEPLSGCGQEYVVDQNLTKLIHAILPLTRYPVPVKLYSDYGVSITPNIYRYEDGKHVIEIDVRAMTDNADVVREAFTYVMSVIAPEVEVKVMDEGGGGYLFTSPSEPLVKASLDVLSELGINAYPSEAPGASDSRHFTPLGVISIDFGPKGGNNHGPDEWVDINTFGVLPDFYEKVALKLLER